jgi:polar amino acid transport system substrate-binding protein|tara:strand:+ start:1474 stop:2307 length:834 start_codon:yes stop_codon:yes gene_type:complete
MKFLNKLILVVTATLSTFMFSSVTQAADTSTWEEIKSRGDIRIGVTQSPPWFYKDPATQEWTGLGASIGKKMAEELGVEFKPVEVTWGTAIAALQANKIDTMFVLDATPARALTVDFPPHALLYYALAVLADDDLEITNWEDLNKSDIKIAVTQGTTMDSYVTKHLPNAIILRFPSNGESIAAFQSRRVQAVSLFSPPLIAMRKKLGRGQIVLPEPIRATASSAAVRKEADKTFRDWINTAITYYYETGQTQVWYEEFLTSFGVDPSKVPSVRKEDW